MPEVMITLNAIHKHLPREERWLKLLVYLGKTKADDELFPLVTVLESNGLNDALWCLRALPKGMNNSIRLLACDFAERVLHLVPAGEDRPRQAIEVARRYARGEATKEELDAARGAAQDFDSDFAWYAVRAVRAVASDSSWDAVWYGLSSARIARATAKYYSRVATRVADREADKEIFRRWCKGE